MKRRTLMKALLGGVAALQFPWARAAARSTSVAAVVFGATPAGIVAAIRLAREGRSVLLVSPQDHIGGMLANGLSMMDALYAGKRSPLHDEFLTRVHDDYARREGEGAESTGMTRFAVPWDWHARPRFEAHVVERIFEEWLTEERLVTVVRGYEVAAVERVGRTIREARFCPIDGGPPLSATAPVYLDCSYEGDLMAAAGVRHVIGREGSDEFEERHAGQVYMATPSTAPPSREAGSPATVIPVPHVDSAPLPGSTGRGDGEVQAYNIRFVFSSDPARSRPIGPPDGYDRTAFARLVELHGADKLALHPIPLMHAKAAGPAYADYTGHSTAYVTASWTERRRIVRDHVAFGLGLTHFLQTDDEVPQAVRASMGRWRLPTDEFADNANVPREVYVREARRMRGRHIFTENDALVAPGTGRTPIHRDSIGVSEWTLDSHPITGRRNADGLLDGEMFVGSTRPSQISVGCLLPLEVDNLLVPVCLSATHVGYGTLRVEPVWMHLAESAAWAAAMALREGIPVSDVQVPRLQALLATKGFLLTFLDDSPPDTGNPERAAMQYLGTRGIFPTYRASPDDALRRADAALWMEALREPPDMRPGHDTSGQADAGVGAISRREFDLLVETLPGLPVPTARTAEAGGPEMPISRGRAALRLFQRMHPEART